MTKLTPRPSIISCGKLEKELLRYLLNHQDERFNVRNYSKKNNINRTTVIDNLNRLISKGFVKKPHIGNYNITKKGTNYLGVSESVRTEQKSVRSPCRTESLSVHYFKYSVKIIDIKRNKLKELNPNEIKENKLPNFTEYYLYYDDCTMVIKLNQVIIHIHDLIASKVEEAHFQGFHKAIAYMLKLKKIAKIEGMTVYSKPHYAKVESYLSKKLSKIDNKYKLNLNDGTSFWIDYSDKREDETDNALYRERIDNIFLDAKDSKSVFSDVDKHDIDLDKIKEILAMQIKLRQMDINMEFQKKSPEIPTTLEKRDNYFG